MGNPRSFTTKHNAINDALKHLTRSLKSHAAKKAAFERAASLPNRLSSGRERAGT